MITIKKRILALAAAVLILFGSVFAATAFDGNDYDCGGGGDDWGGDWGGNDYDYSWDDSGSGSSGGGFSGFISVPIVIIIVIAIILANKNKGSSAPNVRSGQGSQGANVFLPNRSDQIRDILRATDPNFSADDFVTFAKQVYIDIQMAWCNRDMTPVRPVLHQNLFNTTQRQVEEKKKQGVVYHYESIAINTAYLTSFVRESDYEYLTVYLNARMIDYQVDEKTGNIIRGDRTTRWDLRYKMKFVRSVGVTTKEKVSGTQGYNCPNCGAPLEITSSGECPYCGSVVTTGDYSWVLTDFTTVRNDTVDDGIRIPPENNQNKQN